MKEMMVEFIDFIIDLTDDEFDNYLDGISSRYYFDHGGCLEFVKILKHFIPNLEYVISKEKNHVAVKKDNNIFDCNGLRTDNENFELITEDVLIDLEDYLGIPEVKFENKKVNDAIVNELKMCSGNYVKKIVHNINSKYPPRETK
jgi:hypothetical protein